MSLGKKEIKLLAVLGVILYGFLFYIIFVNNYIPEINEVNEQLVQAKEKERALEKDLENIEQKKSELKSKTVISERIGNYVPEKSSMSDYISYMVKLQKLMGYKLDDIKINQPKEVLMKANANENASQNASADNVEPTKSAMDNTGVNEETTAPSPAANTGTKYYSIDIEFKANLAYNEIWDLLSYIEGGSRRIQVTKFNIDPFKEKKDGKQTKAPQNPTGEQVNPTVPIGQIYSVSATISLYTQDLEEANKIFDSSKNKYNRYGDGSGLTFTVASNTAQNTVPNTNNNSTAVNSNSSTSSQKNTMTEPDFILEETGYYTAGENFIVRGTDKYREFFRYKTAGRIDVFLSITDSKYNMKITYAVGKSETITGSIPNRDLLANLKVDVASISENEGIKVNYKIANTSSHKLNLNVTDTGGRIKILDRSGAVIKGKSQKEKVSIN
jgi:hypothetical protein